MHDEATIELHSESCACRGYLWLVNPERPGQRRCSQTGLQDAVRLPASRWIRLGMPRTAEEWRAAEAKLARETQPAMVVVA
jgi:hypothetical protein